MSQAIRGVSAVHARDDHRPSLPHRPPSSTLRLDSLRERVARPELDAARAAFDEGGLHALVALATRALERAETTRARFEMLTHDLEHHADDRIALVEAYLRETVKNKRGLRADLRALRLGKTWVLDVAAIGERVARAIADEERAAEVALAVARRALEQRPTRDVEADAVVALARAQGRWTRRTEALALLATMGRLAPTPETTAAIFDCAQSLVVRSEHRWVQPAALSALAAIDSTSAIAIARDRLAHAEDGDDFLVRERVVELAGRGVLGPAAWASLVDLACADRSEHVRITTARCERDPVRLARTATDDASAKVRATALITLAARDASAAEPSLVAAVADDAADLVTQTAAEELAALARRGRTRDARRVIAALSAAEGREDLSASTRVRISESRLELVVFTDVVLRAAHDALVPVVAEIPVGGSSRLLDPIVSGLDDTQLGCVLAVLSRDDYALGVDRIPGGVLIYRGESRGVAAWRVLHELMHPSPSKRQAHAHTWGRSPAGTLRAPPGGLAELTPTRVPGERVLVERAGGWGRHLPLVDDLLSTGVVRARTVTLVSADGTTTITPPATFLGRLRAWTTTSLRYARLATLRHRALDADEPAMQASFVNEIARATGIAVRFTPHGFVLQDGAHAPQRLAPPRGLAARTLTTVEAARGGLVHSESLPDSRPEPPALLGVTPLALAPLVEKLGGLKETWSDLLAYATTPHGNTLPHLAAYAAVILGALVTRGVLVRRGIDHDREAIPLVIGGWGTRGKSGTERLKAALFQGLGHETLVKTTGCEAMFIHAVPDSPAREIFIYRPYDKATVWEQRDVLSLARSLRVRVFLWECMALQPELVNLLQAQWMRDDYSTITNAYPDHEEVQGPSGYDVANVISEFVPTKGNLITSEEQMLPLLRERAKQRDSNVRVVGARDAALLADDLLARFPYEEHPKNIALVTQLARTLGIPAAVAIAEMADNVVPDIGVLKRYPKTPRRGRVLSFVNGMSANERTAALSNWKRVGLDRFDADATPGEWIVTLVNNREDRVARSEGFAQFLVEDVGAHRHVLVGTNVDGLRSMLRDALDRHLVALSPTRDLDGDGTERLHTARARIDAAFHRLHVRSLSAASAAHELKAFGIEGIEESRLEQLLTPAAPDETFDEARRAIDAALQSLGWPDAETRPFAVAALARRRVVRAVHGVVARDLGTNPIAVDHAFAAAYKAIFDASLVVLPDPSLAGDRILEVIAAHVPPKVHATIVGVQNIKGTGLDFVYRWVSIETVHRMLAELDSPHVESRDRALRGLLLHGDYGLLDARLALQTVMHARARDEDAGTLPYDAVMVRLREIVATRERRLRARESRTIGERVRTFIGETFDYLDATRRRRMAGELLSALVMGRISHATTAERMRAIVARAKGRWAVAST